MEQVNSAVLEASNSLKRIQEFDAASLARREELGRTFAFDGAVDSAKRLIDLFNQMSLEYISVLSNSQLNQLRDKANEIFNLFTTILNFKPDETPNAASVRDQYINTVSSSYDSTFNLLSPIISYLSSRQRDFRALERDARAATQTAKDLAANLELQLAQSKEAAEKILSDIREVAAEQGVSQQAIYFKTESEYHENEVKIWQNRTVLTAVALGIYAVLSIFIHKLPYLEPSNSYESIQLATGKFLLFAVIAFMLIFCSKNFMASRHNYVVNKHRENALKTFTALVDAAATDDKRDVVLSYASACIFSPQDTGYIRTSSNADPAPMKLIEIMPKIGGSS